MVIKQSIKNHLIAARFTIIMTLIFFVLWKILGSDPDFLLIVGSFHLLFSIPALYIHISYTVRNSGEIIEVNSSEIIVRKGEAVSYVKIADLKKVTLYKSASLDKLGIPFTAMEYYYYARIISNSEEEIVITCLMLPKVESALYEMALKKWDRKKGICFLERE